MIVHRIIAGLAAAICGVALPVVPALAQSSTTETIVETMRTLSGKQKTRPSGAKGQCFNATFTPTAEARGLSKSAAFAKPSSVVSRFSVGGGNPKVADATKTVNRGLSLRIDPNGPGQTEFVMINAPVNFPKSPEQMLAFIQARAPGADGKPADYLLDDVNARLAARSPAGFDVLAILGTAEDAKASITQLWADEDKRPTVKLGTLAFTALEKNETCDEQIFDPTNLADGLAGPDDPLFLQRQPAYAIPISQRLQ